MPDKLIVTIDTGSWIALLSKEADRAEGCLISDVPLDAR